MFQPLSGNLTVRGILLAMLTVALLTGPANTRLALLVLLVLRLQVFYHAIVRKLPAATMELSRLGPSVQAIMQRYTLVIGLLYIAQWYTVIPVMLAHGYVSWLRQLYLRKRLEQHLQRFHRQTRGRR